ncbi:MAG: SPOR domain-containing protein [Spirochaetota bacterium]
MLAFFFALAALPLVAQEGTDDASAGENRTTEESEDFSEIRSRLNDEGIDGRTRLNLLFTALDRAPTVAAGLDVLRSHRATLEGDRLAQAFAAEGRLLALSGQLQDAAEAYTHAQEAASEGGVAEYKLEEAKLRLELGELAEAQRLATELISDGRDPSIQREAALLEARAMAEDGRVEEAFERTGLLLEAEHRPTLRPDTVLFHLRLSSIVEDDEAAERAQKLLSQLYPDSPEAMLAADDRRVSDLPRPSAFLGVAGAAAPRLDSDAEPVADSDVPGSGPAEPDEGDTDSDTDGGESETPSGVQVGSFGDPDNAAAMREEMERQGFSAEIRDSDDGDAHRVVVSIPEDEDPQRTLVELKEKGFEGFFLFGE